MKQTQNQRDIYNVIFSYDGKARIKFEKINYIWKINTTFVMHTCDAAAIRRPENSSLRESCIY